MTKWVRQLWSILVGYAQKINGPSDHHVAVSFGPIGRSKNETNFSIGPPPPH